MSMRDRVSSDGRVQTQSPFLVEGLSRVVDSALCTSGRNRARSRLTHTNCTLDDSKHNDPRDRLSRFYNYGLWIALTRRTNKAILGSRTAAEYDQCEAT